MRGMEVVVFGDFYVGVVGCEVAFFVWSGGVGDFVGGEVGTYVIGDDVEDVLVKVGCPVPEGRSQDLCGSFWILGSGCAHAISSLETWCICQPKCELYPPPSFTVLAAPAFGPSLLRVTSPLSWEK